MPEPQTMMGAVAIALSALATTVQVSTRRIARTRRRQQATLERVTAALDLLSERIAALEVSVDGIYREVAVIRRSRTAREA